MCEKYSNLETVNIYSDLEKGKNFTKLIPAMGNNLNQNDYSDPIPIVMD